MISMIKGENIICVSWLSWDSIPLVMHQTMKILSKHNRIIFVDPPVAFSNLAIEPSLIKHHVHKTLQWVRGIRQVSYNLYVYYPPPLALQYGHFAEIDNFNRFLTAISIKKNAIRLGFKNPILWVYHPYAINPNTRFLKEKLFCYDCNDDVGFFYCKNFNKRERLNSMERRVTKRADIVFTTSKYLYDLKKSENENTHILPSGIDVAVFQKGLSQDCKVAPDIGALKKPVIGFVGGMVNSKMNWQWIEKAANEYRDWSFAFVGPLNDNPPSGVLKQKNIFFFGKKPYKDLPSFIKGFDVCIIPYKGYEFMQSSQPGKAFEYMAMGKQVVSAHIPEFEDYGDFIRLSQTYNEFVKNIEAALVDSNDELKQKELIKRAYSWTWQDRVHKASLLIMEALSKL